MNLSTAEKRRLIEPDHSCLPADEQCSLLGLSRSSYYYRACSENLLNLELAHRLDEIYTKNPFYGSRRMMHCLR